MGTSARPQRKLLWRRADNRAWVYHGPQRASGEQFRGGESCFRGQDGGQPGPARGLPGQGALPRAPHGEDPSADSRVQETSRGSGRAPGPGRTHRLGKLLLVTGQGLIYYGEKKATEKRRAITDGTKQRGALGQRVSAHPSSSPPPAVPSSACTCHRRPGGPGPPGTGKAG